MRDEPRQPLTRVPTDPQRADLLELFFDLAFVSSLTLTSEKMATEPTWTGIGQALLALSLLWAVWVTTTFITDLYSPRQRPIRLVILCIMFGIMLMSAALPAAFGNHGLIFGATWFAINLGRGLVLIPSSVRGRDRERVIRALLWSIASGTLWIVGGLMSGPGSRLAVWLAALTVDYVAFGFRLPVPGRAPLAKYEVAPEHLAERYQQIYVLTLGELVLVNVLTLSRQPFSADRIGAFVTAFVTAALLWWSYARGASGILRNAIETSSRRSRLVQTNPYAHWLMVVGVVGTAAGFERVIEHPLDRPGGAMTALIVGGAALFLTGRAVLEYEVFGRIPLSHVLGVVAAIAIASLAPYLPGLVLSVAAGIVLLGVAAGEYLRASHHPDQAPAIP